MSETKTPVTGVCCGGECWLEDADGNVLTSRHKSMVEALSEMKGFVDDAPAPVPVEK